VKTAKVTKRGIICWHSWSAR